MPVEITIISGARKGECIRLDSDSFRIGDDSTCEIYFNPRKDPSVDGRRAQIVLEESGWRIRDAGSGMLLVNQNVVEGATPLRSGDIIRMSDMGPDLTFTLISGHKNGAEAGTDTPESQDNAEAAACDQTSETALEQTGVVESPPAEVVKTENSWSSGGLAKRVGIAAFVILAIVALWILPFPSELRKQARAPGILQLQKMTAQAVNEGQLFTVTAAVSHPEHATMNVAFALEDGPEGMKIDSASGKITWTPAEDQGPGEYSVTVRAVARGLEEKPSDSVTFVLMVQEVNKAPIIEPISDQTLDRQHGDTLRLMVKAHDPDLPQSRLTFALKDNLPAGAQVASETGQLSWTPTADQRGRRHKITVKVTEDGPEPRSAESSFVVTVAPEDPWNAVLQRIAPAICLIMVEQPQTGTTYPFCTACVIRNDALLTSAALAVELDKKRRSGWQIWAMVTSPESGPKLRVQQIHVHRGFTETADSPAEQIYWDLAILQVVGQCKHVATLAGPQNLSDLQPGCELGCLGIPHNAQPLTGFDHPTVVLTRGKLDQHIPLPTPEGADRAGAPVLLQVAASLPENTFGGPVLNQDGRVVGVYAEKAEPADSEVNGRSRFYYAPVVTLVHAWLKGQGIEHWNTLK